MAHRISKRSQVLVPFPAGAFRVVMCSTLVGSLTGPFTFSCFSFAPRMRSADTALRRHCKHDLLIDARTARRVQ